MLKIGSNQRCEQRDGERSKRGFWRPTQNFYARDGVHLNSFGQEKYHRNNII